jgi:hypothetical protein
MRWARFGVRKQGTTFFPPISLKTGIKAATQIQL